MRPNMLLKSLMTGFFVAMSGVAMQASALPLEPFSFHQASGFLVDGTLVGTGGNNIGWYNVANTPAPPAGEYNTIAWGLPITNAGRGLMGVDPFTVHTGNSSLDYSGLRVLGHQGTVTTGIDLGNGTSDWGNWVAISTLYHQNHTISSLADTLTNAVIRSVLTFDHTPEGDIHSDTDSIGISFTETLNAVPCAGPNPNGSICDDFFRFQLGTFAPIGFSLNGHNYQVEFGLGNFVNSATDFPTCPGGTCTVWTAENVVSSMDVLARIREVPEPATLALMGLGLLGLGLMRRRV